MATQTPASTAKTAPHRLPAPALFVGPPSRNASNLSLPRPGPSRPTTSHAPESYLARPARPSASPPSSPTQATGSILDLTRSTSNVPLRARPSKSSIEAQWSDLQRTLNEVETAAPGSGVGIGGWTGGATVFGAGHSKALQELRDAQIRLAEAWGPTAGHDSSEHEDSSDSKAKNGKTKNNPKDKTKGKDTKGERKVSGKSNDEMAAGSSDADSERGVNARPQRDGEEDLKNAAERREKNEEYFLKVKAGVQDVVAKLDEVSKAMRKVEGEGREIWEESSMESRENQSQRGVAA
ncbi:Hypothetical protein D9617_12g035340 [Elsinoe fawcettii]|nr:Hypothetical protein D9617_12g035340 [Elsinoe fawcettii]